MEEKQASEKNLDDIMLKLLELQTRHNLNQNDMLITLSLVNLLGIVNLLNKKIYSSTAERSLGQFDLTDFISGILGGSPKYNHDLTFLVKLLAALLGSGLSKTASRPKEKQADSSNTKETKETKVTKEKKEQSKEEKPASKVNLISTHKNPGTKEKKFAKLQKAMFKPYKAAGAGWQTGKYNSGLLGEKIPKVKQFQNDSLIAQELQKSKEVQKQQGPEKPQKIKRPQELQKEPAGKKEKAEIVEKKIGEVPPKQECVDTETKNQAVELQKDSTSQEVREKISPEKPKVKTMKRPLTWTFPPAINKE